ncbi:MAG: formylglycine-generating enzyme family protein, partial [Bacteroidales bacterium]|nr:formylglycine-generating enzyme family protein [Bacteroidales bacterium]
IDINGAGTYYISILPQTLEGGFTLKCYDGAGGDLGEVRYDNPLEIRRSSIVTLGDISSRISQDGPGYEPPGNDFVETVNGIDLEMVYVAGGTFAMGATPEQGTDYASNERPVHNVTLSSYYIGRFEVTQGQWAKVMGTSIQQQASKAGCSSYYGIGPDYPMYYVSWEEAQAFCQELSRMTGRTYCLPTEAQWEYAARGGNKSKGYKYSGSNNIDEVAWYSNNSHVTSHPVGTKMPNELGLYDMSGNVCEWCSDWYGGYSSSDANNPAGPSTGSDRVHRGDSWYFNSLDCRVSSRSRTPPGFRSFDLGFRVVLLP